MLILSRREAEKILFPQLGITVEISRIQGRKVRLGIKAPDEIRIIRAELEGSANLKVTKPLNESISRCNQSWDTSADIRTCLDAACLAIHQARNQLRQQFNNGAEKSLENALECLEELEAVAARTESVFPLSTPIREAKPDYRCSTSNVGLSTQAKTRPQWPVAAAVSQYRAISASAS